MSIILSELQKRKLPNLLCDKNGNGITTVSAWTDNMRPFLKELILKEEYGQLPPYIKPEISTSTVNVNFAGKATWEKVEFAFTNEKNSYTVPTQLIIPKGKLNCPFVIYINFGAEVPHRYIPAEEIIDNGFAIFSVNYNDITMDNGDFKHGIAGLFYNGERKGDSAGKIAYWAYMAIHMMDYLKERSEAKESLIGIAGHSRLGKTALLAAALDERFDFVCSNNSGCSGVALSRGCCKGGESLYDIYTRFPFWFAPNYEKYINNPELLPFDQHALLSLVAPRMILVGAAYEDRWADNDNQFLACVAASPIWNLYGKKGFISPDKMPEIGDNFNDGDICFHLRSGEHFHSRFDWNVYMQSVKKHFKLI